MAQDEFYLDSLLRYCRIRIFSKVGDERFSRVDSLSYNILHVKVQIGGEGVVESSELT